MSAIVVNEFAKMRHLHVVLLVAVLFAVVTGIGLYAAVFNPDFDRTSASSWNTLLMGMGSGFTLAAPLLLAVVASRLVDAEHQGGGWLMSATSGVTPGGLCRAKLAALSLILLPALIVQTLLVLGAGAFAGIQVPFEPGPWIGYTALLFLLDVAFLALHIWLASIVENQLISVGVGMLGAFLAVFSLLIPGPISRILPWGDYAVISHAGQDSDGVTYITPPYAWIACLRSSSSASCSRWSPAASTGSKGNPPMLRAELIKLKRSTTWLIALILPLLAVTTGSINLANNPDTLDAGWASFTSQVTLFYGLLFFSIGIGLLAATAWRMEHRGTNWNLLLTTTRQPIRLVFAKIVVIAIPVAFMQLVLVAGTLISGTLVLNLDGTVPWQFALVGAISVIAALPLVAIQSLLSMLLKSFAAPVAICLLGCVIGVATVTSYALRPLSYVLPQAINTRALNLGSTALAGSGGLTAGDALPILGTAFGLAAVVVVLTLGAVRVVKLR